MPKLFLIFSHQLTPDQITDAKQRLGAETIIGMPSHLKQLFSNIPPDIETLDFYLSPLVEWINENCQNSDDYVLIQGDFGATYYLVNHCFSLGYACPVYATTERSIIEEQQTDGSVITKRVFKHKIFREYQ